MNAFDDATNVRKRAQLAIMDGASVTENSSDGDDLGDVLVDRYGVDEDFVATYNVHYPRLVRALELSGANGPSAEDVAQEAFARALVHWDRVRSGTNPAGYVYRVAFRLARRSSSRKTLFVKEHPTPTVDDQATLHVGIERGLKTMPAARRRCAVLCLIVGMSTKDAAGTLHIAESTVRKQIERARKDLRIALKDDG